MISRAIESGRRVVCGLTLGLTLLAGVVLAQIAVRNQGYIPFSEEPIQYRTTPVNDPVQRLQQRLDRGETTLCYEPGRGYLRSVLELLDIPISSQSLVFSKTSFQTRRISPKTPRALYFNDDVYVGWVQGGKALEIISFDARQGAIFYILDEERVERPVFQRAELDCTQCHIVPATRDVPGVFLRSVYTRPSGAQAMQTSSYTTGHESPLNERFGGWYVTGTHGRQTHLGNVFVTDPDNPQRMDRRVGANRTSLAASFDTQPYLTTHSDIVAQLVQAHQTQMHNLITLTGYRARIAIHSRGPRRDYEAPAEELVRYLLFAGEVRLIDQVRGSSSFTRDFAARGPRDQRGRSLRDFDLRKRLFKYPCSYLIYSEAFDALPDPARSYVYRRLLEVLTGRDQSPTFAHLTQADRTAILEILLATKTGLPPDWPSYRL